MACLGSEMFYLFSQNREVVFPQTSIIMNKNIWQKLLEIQRELTSFTNSEPAEKTKAGTKDPEYRYVPGWQITDQVRALMDKYGLMMPVNVLKEEHEMVEYPVYKILDGKVTSFVKKENLSVITMQYTWIDCETGETAGPFQMVASGSNGIDKSTASALSTAERYIFLKFFHIPTKDNDELDAHDSSFIPGLKEQPVTATDSQIARDKTGRKASVPQTHQGNKPPVQQKQPQQQPLTQNARPSYGQEYEEAVNSIAMFARDTPSHIETVNRVLRMLQPYGYPVGETGFINTLVAVADERRLKISKRS